MVKCRQLEGRCFGQKTDLFPLLGATIPQHLAAFFCEWSAQSGLSGHTLPEQRLEELA